jgi:hypothetical protein
LSFAVVDGNVVTGPGPIPHWKGLIMLANPSGVIASLIGTCVVGQNGRPLVLHHGTPAAFDEFRESRDIGFHFGSLAQAKARERSFKRHTPSAKDAPWLLMQVALVIKHPVVVTRDLKDWDAPLLLAELTDVIDGPTIAALSADYQALEQAAHRRTAEYPGAQNLGQKAWARLQLEHWLDANRISLAAIRDALEARGYDGIAYWRA